MSWGQNGWLASMGIWLGFLAWGTSTQVNYSLVPWECDTGVHITPWISLTLIVLSLIGGAVSWRSFRARSQRLETATPTAGTPLEMLAVMGMLASCLFALIVLVQGAAAFIVMRCAP